MFSYYSSIIFLCWISLAALCILVHENDRIPREGKRLMYLTYLLVGVSAAAEWCGVQLDGRMGMPGWVLKMTKCADYILTPMAGGALVLQMRLNNRWQKAMLGLLGANVLLQLIAAPTGWMIVIDEQNHYTHGPLYSVYLGVCLGTILLIIAQFILYGKTFRRQNRVSLYAIMFVVTVTIIIQEMPNGFRISYIGMTIGAALMFIHYTEYSLLASDQELAEQRIRLMLSQIKPHFLYNTLGSIEALCERDPKAAKLAARKFSKYLRGNMNALGEETLIQFDRELQHTQLYLELEQIRFGEALRVEYDIRVHDFLIPPLTLEPIVENAVKHGIRMNPDGRGTVKVTAMQQEGLYELQVIDDGPGYDPASVTDDESHIGIRNVRDRLERICGGNLVIKSAPEHGTVVTLRLPKEGRYKHADLRHR